MARSSIDLNRPSRSYKRLSIVEKRRIVLSLVGQSRDGNVPHGFLSKLASEYGVVLKTICTIWKKVHDKLREGVGIDVDEFFSRPAGLLCRNRVELDPGQIVAVSLAKRKSIRSLAAAVGVSKMTMHQRFKEGKLKRHSNAIKPSLTEVNKRARLNFCLSQINPRTVLQNPTFKGMYDVVHIDEKWFNLSKATETFYLAPSENEPYRTCQNKKCFTKVMFLVAVAHPRFDEHRNHTFSGKIGVFPFTYQEPARRSSKNRTAGTVVTKAMTCVNRKPHISIDDPEFVEEANKDGFHISLACQPPNSPDLNVLDIGFFSAIQSLQYKESPRNIDELVAAVEKSFDALDPETLNRVFLSLQLVMNAVIKDLGGNNYKIPHLNKLRLEREGSLPNCMPCDDYCLNRAMLHLHDTEGT